VGKLDGSSQQPPDSPVAVAISERLRFDSERANALEAL
jgi:hypothetical protein